MLIFNVVKIALIIPVAVLTVFVTGAGPRDANASHFAANPETPVGATYAYTQTMMSITVRDQTQLMGIPSPMQQPPI
jgi:hypothetical protein